MAEHAKKHADFVADDRRRGAHDFLIDASHFAHETSALLELGSRFQGQTDEQCFLVNFRQVSSFFFFLQREFMDIEPRIYLPIEGKSFYHESSEFLNGNL